MNSDLHTIPQTLKMANLRGSVELEIKYKGSGIQEIEI